MKLFPWQKEKEFFTEEEKARVVDAVQKAEQLTSGEIRVFIESHCHFVDAIDRAKEIFFKLAMEKTEARNGTLIYLAVTDRQVAVYGDEGIHQKVGQTYWDAEVKQMLLHFSENHVVDGLVKCIDDIGDALHQHFPFDRNTDKNELPDEIVFGK